MVIIWWLYFIYPLHAALTKLSHLIRARCAPGWATKNAWREAYMMKNPGTIVTRYKFSHLFCQAWWGPNDTKQHNCWIQSNRQLTDLEYYTRVLPKLHLFVNEQVSNLFHSNSSALNSITTFLSIYSDQYKLLMILIGSDEEESISELFTEEEEVLYTKRWEQGYDIPTDQWYNIWLSQQGCITIVDKPNTTVTKVLANIPPVKKNPSFLPKTTARLLTSEECRQEINEKEKKKAEALRLKEERKVQRQQKHEEKIEESKVVR